MKSKNFLIAFLILHPVLTLFAGANACAYAPSFTGKLILAGLILAMLSLTILKILSAFRTKTRSTFVIAGICVILSIWSIFWSLYEFGLRECPFI